ncbi:class I adenylate cyclase [Klebsiella pneumoniae subsp. pneumoniae]|nr:class I adenylate cyclase [Klebsiella pneumoniae subsp. pneumoniae]
MRRCFYLKVCENSAAERAARRLASRSRQPVGECLGLGRKRLMMLDNRANWKIDEVRRRTTNCLDAMMQSYRNLIRFARRNNLSVSASPQDIGVLTRKLYAAFEALPGKVTLVNPQISPDLSETEPDLYPRAAGRAKPYRLVSLYNRAPDMGIDRSAISRWNITVILISWWPGPGLTAR